MTCRAFLEKFENALTCGLLFKTYGNVLMAVKTTAHRTESSVCGPSRARYRLKTKRVTTLSSLYLHSKGDYGSAVYLSTILTEQSNKGISIHFPPFLDNCQMLPYR